MRAATSAGSRAEIYPGPTKSFARLGAYKVSQWQLSIRPRSSFLDSGWLEPPLRYLNVLPFRSAANLLANTLKNDAKTWRKEYENQKQKHQTTDVAQ